MLSVTAKSPALARDMANTYAQVAQMFIDASDDRAGLALINRGTPANNLEDGVMLLTLFRAAAMEYKTASDLSYNLGKKISLDYAVCPHAADEDDALWQEAYRFNYPAEKCILPMDYRRFGIEGAYLSAIRETEDGVFMRIFNPFEKAKEAVVTLPEDAGKVYFTNGLMENTEETAPEIQNGKIRLMLKPFGVQGLKIR